MPISRRPALWFMAALTLILGHVEALWAQSDGQAGAQAALAEVTVTAERRTESLQRTPIAVTALSPEMLSERNIQTTQDLMGTTPGLQVSTQNGSNGSGSATFFLRGMGQESSINGSEPAVGVYIDDFYYPSLQGSVLSILDLQQVEVLRGPQGTLFGRDTIGGAIRYTSVKPSFTTNGYVQGTGGSHSRGDATSALNFAFSERAALRLTLGHLKTNGYVRQQDGDADAGGTKTDLIRAQFRWLPTDVLDINLSAQYSRRQDDGFAYVIRGPIEPQPGSLPFLWNQIPPGIASPYDNRFASACDYCQAGTHPREFSDTRFSNVNATVQWQVSDDLTLKSLTGWQRIKTSELIDFDGSTLPIFESPADVATTAVSQELQLNDRLFDQRLTWVAGLYYYYQHDVPEPEGVTVLGMPLPATADTRRTRTEATFADGTFRLTDVWSILGGVRYSRDQKDATVTSLKGTVLGASSASFPSTTGRAGVRAQWTSDLMTYASVSKGFRAGGFALNPGNDQYYKFNPEAATSYETGARMDVLDHKLRFNPTLFYNNWDNIQVQSVVPTPQGVAVVLQNAAKAHSYGAELESEGALTENFRLYGNLAYLRIKYDSIGNASGITTDSPFERAPKITYAVGARYQRPITDRSAFKVSVNWSWQDTQNSTPTDTDTLRLPSYGLLGARLELNAGDHWTVAVLGTNLTDKTYYIGGVNFAANVGAAHYDLGRPREFGISLRYELQ